MKTHHLPDMPESWLPVASIFSALGDTTRQQILLLFEPAEELCIKDIVEVIPLSRTAVVHHLTVLERAGILQVRRQGKSALYRVEPQSILAALSELQDYILGLYPGPATIHDQTKPAPSSVPR